MLYYARPLFEGRLREELYGIHYVSEKRIQAAIDFMVQSGIASIRDISDTDLFAYRERFLQQPSYKGRFAFFEYALEKARNWGYRKEAERLLSFCTEFMNCNDFTKRACYYLAAHGITDPSEIDFSLRNSLSDYLMRIDYACISPVLSAIDRMKLESIRTGVPPFHIRLPMKGKVFLAYYPYYPAAQALYRASDKARLIYDMDALATNTIRRQFIKLIHHILHQPLKGDRLRSYYVQPLRLLYEAAILRGWEDLEKLSAPEETWFKDYADAHYGKALKWHKQILFKVRRYLFVSADSIHWDATVWFLERFHVEDYRVCLSFSLQTFSFSSILSESSRHLFQTYMKYLIGVTDQSLTTIKTRYRCIKIYLKYMEAQDWSPSELSRAQFEEFLLYIERDHHLGDRPFNQLCTEIRRFYDYLALRDLAVPLRFDPCFYKKSFQYIHHDRAVPREIYMYTLLQLRYFPEELRLMYLHLLSTGLRISEICILKAENYRKENGVCWLRVYQNKMKAEKMIPIPDILYELMDSFIQKQALLPTDYVFRNSKGGPYKSGTFLAKMRQYCDAYGINQDTYTFRSHDFRHTVATICHQNGMSISAIRDYLGHTQSDMTKQYIDFIPERIRNMSESYFESHSLLEENS